ncbi:MAG: TRAP transporter permease [Pseudomonadales bacterium]|nr:TRAP transporter permease [Pseudomonadales bacterium]
MTNSNRVIASDSGFKKDKILPVLVLMLLMFTILAGTGENLHSQLLQLGLHSWKDYTLLRSDAPAPSCNPNVDVTHSLSELEKDFYRDDEFGLLTFDKASSHQSIVKQRDLCIEEHALAEATENSVTDTVKLFSLIETSMGSATLFSISKQKLVFLILLFSAAAYTTITRHHISFKPIKTQRDYFVATTAQLMSHGVFAISTWFYKASLEDSGVAIQNPELVYLLIMGFAALSIISLYQLLFPPENLRPKGNPLQAFLSIPIYSIFGLIAANYFFVIEGHFAGIAIFFGKSFSIASIFVTMALYIWCGMLLRQTRLAKRVFEVFKPWGLPPEILAVVAVIMMGLPTAYSGASGIILLAVGAVIYEELRRVGARRQLALATTAMTGGAGVVLSPCILIVMISMLNKEVVTDELFYWGKLVFGLTIFVFVVFALITNRGKFHVESPKNALKPTLNALSRLIPYVGISLGVGVIYAFALNAYLDQFSAPIILPVILFAFLAYEKIVDVRHNDERAMQKVGNALTESVSQASTHIGAILIFGCCSLPLAGVVERSSSMMDIPEAFSSVWVAMCFFVVAMILIGMFIDAIGAVALISGSFAAIAYNSGIHPIHFWMVALVAVELGYLSPPVAMNHLLTRQVVGESEVEKAALEGDSFWYRHEKILLPIVVMGTTLVIVAFGPLIVGYDALF